MAGNEDDRKVDVPRCEFTLKIKAALSRQSNVEYEAGGSFRAAPRLEEFANGSEQLRLKAD